MHLLERVMSDSRLVVDRGTGKIRNVRVLGLNSANGRTYSREAVGRALSKYQGISVNVDHAARPGESRGVEHRFGWLENVRQDGDGGLRGDLHFLKSHPLAERVCEAAERNPRLFGLSHNVSGRTARRAGSEVVEEVDSVFSVDLVCEPATVGGLHESRSTGAWGQATGRFREQAIPPDGETLGHWLQGGQLELGFVLDRREKHFRLLREVRGELARRGLDERSRQLLEMAEAGVMGAPGEAQSGVQSMESPAISDADAEVREVLKRKLIDLLDGNWTIAELADKVKELLAAAKKGNPLLTAGTASESRLVAPVAPALSAGERVQLLEQRSYQRPGSDTAPSGPAALGQWLQGF